MPDEVKPRGRPRSFDRAEGLRRALALFRDRGYDGVTVSDLQQAMGGIAAPSFYAAFGSKDAVFREAVELYRGSVGAAMAAPLQAGGSTRAAVEAMLRAMVEAFCAPGEPRGCLLVLGALNGPPATEAIQAELRDLRQSTRHHLTKRLKRGIADGDLAATVDVPALAAFFTTLIHGLSIQARDGVSKASLHAAVDVAMAAWDPIVARRG